MATDYNGYGHFGNGTIVRTFAKIIKSDKSIRPLDCNVSGQLSDGVNINRATVVLMYIP